MMGPFRELSQSSIAIDEYNNILLEYTKYW